MEETTSRKSFKSMKDEDIANLIVVPPDGGWGWIIVAAAFGCNLIADGILYSFGIFLEELSTAYNVTVGNVTLVGSIITCFYYLTGPFVSALLNRFGFRFVAISGSIIGASGFALASICYSFPLFILTSGVIVGIGCGMITIPAVIVVGYYFEKWRALATGIATCGSGIGTLMTPLLVNFLLERMDWRNTYRVLACMVLATGILAILYRPLMPVRAIQDEKEIQIIQADSIGSFESVTTKCCGCNYQKHHNIRYPTTADVVPIETVILEIPERSDETSTYSFTTFATSTAVTVTAYPSVTQTTIVGTAPDSRASYHEKKCSIRWRKFLKFFCCGHCPTLSRPMYRDDIFFGHSLMLLPQYKESLATKRARKQKMRQTQLTSRGMPKPKSTGYHMSVTRVTTHREIYGRQNGTGKCSCPLAVLRTLSTMLDFRLLKSPAFQIFSWSGMFIVFGYMVPYLYIKDRAVSEGLDANLAVWLLSTIGAANTVGRIISGILPSVTNVKVIVYSYVCIAIAGTMTVVSGLLMTIELQFLYAFLYGITGSCIATLRPIIVVELFGLEHLTNAFGLQLMFMAFAGFAGTMTAGIAYDTTHNYNVSFYISGGCLVISALLLTFIKRVRDYEKKHNCSGGL